MRSKIKNKVKFVLGLLITTMCLAELVLFIAIFFMIIVAMLFFTFKGILVSDTSFSLFIASFILFFLFLSVRKGKRFILILCCFVFLTGTSFKFHSLMKNWQTMQYEKKYSKTRHDQLADNKLEIDSLIDIEHRSYIFKERFDKEPTDWEVQNYSFPENGCEMSESQIEITNSMVTLSIDQNKHYKAKPFKGGEISTKQSFLFGSFTVRMKNQIVPGTVSSFFLMNKWKPQNWEHKEIDIEFLGKNTNAVQLTIHHFENGGRDHVSTKYTHQLGFDSSSDFHDYTIIWDHDSISWLVDKKWIHTEKELLIDEPMYIRMNHWTTDRSWKNKTTRNWLGALDKNDLPSKVFYDWVEYMPIK